MEEAILEWGRGSTDNKHMIAAAATILLAGLCVWIISWESDE